MNGKEKCKALKEIRQKIACTNDIAFAVSECTHKGDCKGTCPKCEAELRYLERELEKKRALGKAVVVAGVSVGLCTGLTACVPMEELIDFVTEHTVKKEKNPEVLAGDVAYTLPDIGDYEGGLTEYPED